MSHPRVAHVVPALFDERIGVIGGAERYALELARHMAEVTPTRIVTFGPDDETRFDGKLRIDVIGGARPVRNDENDRFSLALFDRLAEADVVHCHQIYTTASTMAAEFCRRTARRVFATDLGGGAGYRGNASNELTFDGWLYISQFSRQILSQITSEGEVISGGVDSTRFTPALQSPGFPMAIFVGRILPHKGIDVLIRALPARMKLNVIGRPYDPRYLSDLTALAASRQVSFVTDLEDSDLPDAYRLGSCVVLPSVYRDMYGKTSFAPELLGQTLLEGMAAGLPAICSDAGAMPEVVVSGETGFVVPAGDVEALSARLEWICDNRTEARSMGRKARLHMVDNYRWSAVVERCLEAYSS